MKLSEYQDVHVDRSTFIVKPNHQVDPIENVILTNPEYNVVRKKNTTPDPEHGSAFNDTTTLSTAQPLTIQQSTTPKSLT